MDLSKPAGPAAEPQSVVRAAPSTRIRRRAVVNLRDVRRAWEFPTWAQSGIASAFPHDWEVTFVESPVDGRGDGAGVSEEAIAAAAGAEIYVGLGAPREVFLAATQSDPPALRWMHTGTAGVASLLFDELMRSDVVLTNSAGVHAPAIAETVFAMMLHFARGIDYAVRSQMEGRWDTAPFSDRLGSVNEIQGSTLGVVGLGGIGLEVARRALAFDMNVIATRRSGRPAPAGIEVLIGPDALIRLLQLADYIVLTVPSTAATRGLIGPAEVAAIKPGAVLINVARGDVLDEDALIRSLQSGTLRGAGLDVFRTEPLPATSPLWQMPNVLVTPHVSATTPRFWTREVELIRDNIARYLAGRALRNVVDKQRGY